MIGDVSDTLVTIEIFIYPNFPFNVIINEFNEGKQFMYKHVNVEN